MPADEIVERVRREYGDGWVDDVLAALDRYGTESYHREIVRVQHAILDLSKGDPETLEGMVQAAVIDYRDVLYWQTLDR
jgi:hypothetical protein